MTRKDFVLIANVFAQHTEKAVKNQIGQPIVSTEVRNLAVEFARVLKQTNPRFDAQRFFTACGLL